MGAIIDTAHRQIGKFGVGPYGEVLDGFTSGNMAGGVLPTELSADWCDGIQMEIANCTFQWSPFALTSAYTDLGLALDYSHINRRPTRQSNPVFTFRSQSDAALAGNNGVNCGARERTLYTSAAASGSVNNAGILSIPTNTQCFCEFRGVVTQSDAITTNYAHFHFRAAVRNSAGVVTIQDQASVYTYTPGIIYTFLVTVTGANAIMRVTVPAVPAAKVHNIMVHSTMVTVTATS